MHIPRPSASESGQLLRYLDAALRATGVDADAVLHRLGLTAADLQRAELRTLLLGRRAYFAAVQAVSGAPHAGLLMAPQVPVPTQFLPTYLLLSSDTLRAGWQRVAPYLRLVSDALDGRLVEDGGEVRALIESGGALDDPLDGHGELLLACGILRVLERMTGGDFRPRRVDLRSPAPKDSAPFEALFGCPVRFDCPASALVFAAALLDRPAPFPDPALLQVHTAVAEQALAELARDDVRRAAAALLEQAGGEGRFPDLEQLATRLQMTPRQLRLRLQAAGCRYTDLLDAARLRLAQRLLRDPALPLAEVADRCGFSEQSAFQRAFRRWTGTTPQRWRDQPPLAT